MLFGNRKTLAVMLMLALIAPASATDLKSMITDAINNGKSGGYLDPDIAKYFINQTKSKEPVQFMANRINKLSDRCAELEVLVSQPGVPMKDKELGVALIGFKLPICADGSYPEMLKSMNDERIKKEMADCQHTVKKGAAKDSYTEGSIEFKDCPKGGVVGLFYDGQCKVLNPGKDAVVHEYDFDANGKLLVKLQIPKTCLAEKNKWQLYLFEKDNPKAAKVLIGNTSVGW